MPRITELTLATSASTTDYFILEQDEVTKYSTVGTLVTTILNSPTILTQASADSFYESKTSAATTYETKASASASYATFLTITSASAGYETKASAATTYETKSSAASKYATFLTSSSASTVYETKASAASTYLTITNASTTYQTKTSAGAYLTSASAATVYETKSSAAATYITITNASTTYQTKTSAQSAYDTFITSASAEARYAVSSALGSPAFLGVTGADTTVVTGTAGASGNLSGWNLDGDLIDAAVSSGSFATAAQGALADTAVQPADISDKLDFIASAEQTAVGGETGFEFSSIPAGTKRITVLLNDSDLSGNSDLLVRLNGETAGYKSGSGLVFDGGATQVIDSTSGFAVINRAGTVDAVMTIHLSTGNKWVAGHAGRWSTDRTISGGGAKELSAAITSLQIVRTGSDTFVAGSKYTITYEG